MSEQKKHAELIASLKNTRAAMLYSAVLMGDVYPDKAAEITGAIGIINGWIGSLQQEGAK